MDFVEPDPDIDSILVDLSTLGNDVFVDSLTKTAFSVVVVVVAAAAVVVVVGGGGCGDGVVVVVVVVVK